MTPRRWCIECRLLVWVRYQVFWSRITIGLTEPTQIDWNTIRVMIRWPIHWIAWDFGLNRLRIDTWHQIPSPSHFTPQTPLTEKYIHEQGTSEQGKEGKVDYLILMIGRSLKSQTLSTCQYICRALRGATRPSRARYRLQGLSIMSPSMLTFTSYYTCPVRFLWFCDFVIGCFSGFRPWIRLSSGLFSWPGLCRDPIPIIRYSG